MVMESLTSGKRTAGESKMQNKERLTLSELNGLVREVIETTLPDEYWVEAELSECRESRGHCYMELIQRDERSATPIARASAKCWSSKWLLIRPYFERITQQHLQAGMKVLLRVYPQFHEAYGFSWIVTDIDPTYTLGDQARRRQEIIRQLKEEGVFDLQRELQLPLFCLHIAVISSETAAGYGDFAAQLADAPYAFQSRLFPAIMQGEQTEQSIIQALEQIYEETTQSADHSPFDCVVIIRGGGASSDLSGFDTLSLAENVANFPLPIITGIGHERDECILDMVSHQRVKTPTAAAAFLISHAQQLDNALNDTQHRLTHAVQQALSVSSLRLQTLHSRLSDLFTLVRSKQEARIDQLAIRISSMVATRMATSAQQLESTGNRLPLLMERRLTAEQHKLSLLEEKLKALDPTLLLKRGYSITLKDGKAIRNPKTLRPGDIIETKLEKGLLTSTVT
jgi:exodeoxyribonuclease VII large subunit